MINPEVNQVLEALHEAVARDLLKRIQSGEASPAEITAALKLLRDNGIEAMPTQDNPLGQLADKLPEFIEQDAELH
jgi:hypothetical protein